MATAYSLRATACALLTTRCQAREHWLRTTGEAPRMLVSAVDQSIGYAKHADMGWWQPQSHLCSWRGAHDACGSHCAPHLQATDSRSPCDRGSGAYASALGFSDEVAGAVRLHVSAKRALVGMDPGYMAQLSQASIDTLAQQGGPMSAEELADFHAMPCAQLALRLRRYDDEGKAPGSVIPRLESYRQLLYEHLCRQTMSC